MYISYSYSLYHEKHTKGGTRCFSSEKKYPKNCSSDLKSTCKVKQEKVGCCDNFSFTQRFLKFYVNILSRVEKKHSRVVAQ